MVPLSDVGLGLGGSRAPLGCCVAFIERPCPEVLAEIETVRAGRELPCIGPVDFETAVGHLDPMLMAIRSLAAHCQDGRWSWHESGIVQPFERPQRYRARLKRNRLDRPLLVEYLNAMGIDVDSSAFYGPAWSVRQVVSWETRRVSVEAFRRESGWQT